MGEGESKFHRLWETKNKNDEWWSSFVTAPLAILVNLVVVDFKWLSPNLITLVSFVTAIVATAFIVLGGATNYLIAAILIHVSHIMDCMDGQMARYRGVSSRSGSYFDKVTDLIQVFIWFGAVGYAAYAQTGSVLPIFLALVGVSFYSLRGYVKYVFIYTEMLDDKNYLEAKYKEVSKMEKEREIEMNAGPGKGIVVNLRWFLGEQRKLLSFDEGVFIFMLSLALILNTLTEMLWIFAVSQIYYGLARSWQRGRQLYLNQHRQVLTSTEK